MITIMLVDDHGVIRDGLKFYFDGQDEFKVVSEASDGKEALEKLGQQPVDIVITDISMPGMDGLEFMRQLNENFPDQKVIALTMLGESQYVTQMLSMGVNGYILKNAGKQQLLEAVQAVSRGETYVSKEATSAIINALTNKQNPKPHLSANTPLSNREKEVLKLIIEEFSNQEIAAKLFISVRTVETHKHNMLEKTGCKNIAGLVMYAVERKLV
jgi:DNA-binding NarL/FixJ family response regulator